MKTKHDKVVFFLGWWSCMAISATLFASGFGSYLYYILGISVVPFIFFVVLPFTGVVE